MMYINGTNKKLNAIPDFQVKILTKSIITTLNARMRKLLSDHTAHTRVVTSNSKRVRLEGVAGSSLTRGTALCP